jgi:hypothetical protein
VFSERWGQILLADYRSQAAAENSGSDRRLPLQGELERDAATTLVFVLRSLGPGEAFLDPIINDLADSIVGMILPRNSGLGEIPFAPSRSG